MLQFTSEKDFSLWHDIIREIGEFEDLEHKQEANRLTARVKPQQYLPLVFNRDRATPAL